MSAARDIEAFAATWLMRREEPDWSAADENELQAWLDQSYAHKAAYWRLESGWRAADRIAAVGSAPVAAVSRRRPAARKWRWYAVAASIAGMLIAVPAALQVFSRAEFSAPSTMNYETPLGGHEQVALADGSTIELNTATLVRAAVTGNEREVWLEKGEVFFSIRHLAVPFVVHAGPRVVTVLGTKFSVWRDGDKVRVAVTEGRVLVSDSNRQEPAPTATIARGDMLQAEAESTLVMQDSEAKVERSLSWREGMLQFDQTPLVQAAQEFNRYNRRKLVVTGQAATIPIGGSFKTGNAEAFARLLHDAYGLQVEKTPTEIKISG
jgi:transmembrane sensor